MIFIALFFLLVMFLSILYFKHEVEQENVRVSPFLIVLSFMSFIVILVQTMEGV